MDDPQNVVIICLGPYADRLTFHSSEHKDGFGVLEFAGKDVHVEVNVPKLLDSVTKLQEDMQVLNQKFEVLYATVVLHPDNKQNMEILKTRFSMFNRRRKKSKRTMCLMM